MLCIISLTSGMNGRSRSAIIDRNVTVRGNPRLAMCTTTARTALSKHRQAYYQKILCGNGLRHRWEYRVTFFERLCHRQQTDITAGNELRSAVVSQLSAFAPRNDAL